MKQHSGRWFATLPQECKGHELSGGLILAVNSLDYAAAAHSFPAVNRSKLNDTVLSNLPRYSEPVRTYLHQIGPPEDLRFVICSSSQKTLRLRRLRTSCRVTWH
jgi:hypothetical protein